ncbi:hypothetical protein QVD17_00467 [Tagetes erecta]|uniref:Fibronectin type-III domain-containing protein n=1 Tax=Tagetes erecta TaxID=13708 RepID=A0AAD8P785_TARER|nr:hypothetical protein QVD17_00467 [Tagetes erecta]
MSPTRMNLSKKQKRKSEHPTQFLPITELGSSSRSSSTRICDNSACRNVLLVSDTFCKRCSCCICLLYDENKDPSLWLECTPDSPADSCGFSCHVECALQKGKVGVVDCGQALQLDGSYCCASCGKISEILRCWRRQMTIAKGCRRLNSLYYRIYLCYRMLEGTTRFQVLHDIVKLVKAKLESEVSPLNGESAKTSTTLVNRLSIASEVHALIDAAIEIADEVSATLSNASLDGKDASAPLADAFAPLADASVPIADASIPLADASVPIADASVPIADASGPLADASVRASCKLIFEEITSSSVVLVLIVSSTSSSSDIIGFKLWYSKTTEETHTKNPISILPEHQRRISITNLQPCTEYSFRIVTVTRTGDLDPSEAKCSTGSVEILHNNPVDVTISQNEGTMGAKDVQDVGILPQPAWVEERGSLDVNSDPSHGLDLNIALNDLSKDEAGHGSGGFENRAQHEPNGDKSAVESRALVSRKRPATAEARDCDSALMIAPISVNNGGPSNLDDNFEFCMQMIRWLECQGYITQEFRQKLFTWFGLSSTEQDRRVVSTFIRTLGDDPVSLAGQLVDSFADIINNKRPRGDK